jgi:phosphatidylserine/phosphatidylglycerophosphate/cardiolipin synthase-like enzyme
MRLLILIAELMLATSGYAAPAAWFAPTDNCTAVIVAEFDKAEKSINMQMYNFTSPDIADALIRAQKRGVDVRLLLDWRAQQTSYSQAGRCKAAGCTVYTDASHPIAHVKYSGIDGKRFLGGSFNYSRQANKNSEDLTLEDEPKLVKEFADNFESHWAHADKYTAAATKPRVRRRR